MDIKKVTKTIFLQFVKPSEAHKADPPIPKNQTIFFALVKTTNEKQRGGKTYKVNSFGVIAFNYIFNFFRVKRK
jgi:hypothetical protein